MSEFLLNFENKLYSGLMNFIGDPKDVRIGVAVSGGADSVSLLLGLSSIREYFAKINFNLYIHVITVNHNIRPVEETDGDANFVVELCKKLCIDCKKVEIPRGKVLEFSENKKCGVEAAARLIRYELFDAFIQENNLDFLCLAHNQNDQVETVFMRFLQGSSTGELAGIPASRGKYIRPLLGISRSEIECYLNEKNQNFKIDKTNYDLQMKRNLIRNELLPFVEDKFIGYRKSLINLSEKCQEDESFISVFLEEALKKSSFNFNDGIVSFDVLGFNNLHSALKRRVLYYCFDICGNGSETRISYQYLKEVSKKVCENKSFNDFCMGFNVWSDGCAVFVQNAGSVATETSFFVIIEEDGCYEGGGWKISSEEINQKKDMRVTLENEQLNISECCSCIRNFKYPFMFRSRQPSDLIKAADGKLRSVNKIIKDWKLDKTKDFVPVIQALGSKECEVSAILGKCLGLNDWIV